MRLKGTILIVDDEVDVLGAFKDVLGRHEGLHVLTATNAELALDAARIHRPDVIFSDLAMPEIDGLELCRRVRSDPNLEGVLFVVITGNRNVFAEIDPEIGIDDTLVKPIMADELVAKVASLLRLKRIYDELRADKLEMERLHATLQRRLEEILSVLVHLVDMSIPGSAARGAETARVVAKMAERFDVPAVLLRDLDIAARLHEVGKVILSAERSESAEGPEDVIEGDGWRYAVAAKNLFARTEGLSEAAELIGSIYENWDGTGHPERLRQGQIPLRSRILRIVIDHSRLVDSGLAPLEALEQMQPHAGTRYDPLALAYFDAITRGAQAPVWHEGRVQVPVTNLAEGMVLADDLYTSSGMKLLAKGGVITAGMLDTILRRHRSDPILQGAWIERGRSA